MTKQPLAAAELNELVAGLKKLSATSGGAGIRRRRICSRSFRRAAWTNLFHNAAAVLQEVSDYELRVRLQDADFHRRAKAGGWPISTPILRTKTPGATSMRRSCTKIRSPIFPPSAGSTNSLPISAGGPRHPRRRPCEGPRATWASVSSASVCFTAKVIFSRRLTRTTGRRSFTTRLTRRTSRSSKWWTAAASRLCAAWRSA